ncbi:FkbM family methyltransferase [Pedobacter sandarakinus]|uniref:FkbM family methyltransferase n=1 Tax=Pedobacter sandarakinus TaxID=353156 RepID=UPI00224538B4|nr:FkbM family methyltransferase [Pedobacter sandarakinus]MCX2575933.1 FkbM family methyltransferase [Pedobacter sandarakinus]
MIYKIKKHIRRLIEPIENNQFGKISFSQSGEDLIVEFIFNQLGIDRPSYIDIGAHDPFYLSNTALFYKKGSRGINIEPDFDLFNKIAITRVQDINLNIGVGESTDVLDFYIMNVPTLNTFSLEQIDLYKSEGEYFVKEIKKVNIDTIKNVLNKHNQGVFPDFLSLDAEGIDELVIKNLDFSNQPKVICVETLSFSSSGNGIKNTSLIDFIKENGYILYADTYINSIFVSEKFWKSQNI